MVCYCLKTLSYWCKAIESLKNTFIWKLHLFDMLNHFYHILFNFLSHPCYFIKFPEWFMSIFGTKMKCTHFLTRRCENNLWIPFVWVTEHKGSVGHVALGPMTRDESLWWAEDLWILLSVELMYEKDKASELSYAAHSQCVGGSAAGATGRTDVQI